MAVKLGNWTKNLAFLLFVQLGSLVGVWTAQASTLNKNCLSARTGS